MDEERFWWTCDDPLELLRALHPPRTLGSMQPQSRQSRLYLLACARQQWHRLPLVARELVLLAEMVTDSPRKEEPLRAAVAPIAAGFKQSPGESEDCRTTEAELLATSFAPAVELARRSASKDATPASSLTPEEWRNFGGLVYLPFEVNTPSYHWVSREYHSIDLLREVYGNPYRHIQFKPSWRTHDVKMLAIGMYSRGDFSAMPYLADALQEAFCDNEDILNHCRTPGPHVRGCWVVDHLLQLR